MKKALFAAIIAPFFFLSCDKDDITAIQQDSFIKYYGSGLNDAGIKVIETNDGYLIMANIENPNTGKDICLIRTDAFGNSIAPIKVYGDLWEDHGSAIKPNQAGYVIAGYTHRAEESNKDAFLVQINLVGDTLWTRSFDINGFNDEAFDLSVRDDNQHIILAGYYNKSEINKDYLLIETDADGNMLAYPDEYGSQVRDEVLYSITESGTDYLLAGYSYEQSSTAELYKSFVVLRWNGITSPVKYPPPRLGYSSEATTIVAANDNEFYISCSVNPTQSGGSQIYICKMNGDGNYLWQKEFGERQLNIVNGLSITGNYLFTIGTSTDAPGTMEEAAGDMLIVRTDLEGENPHYFYAGDGISYQGNGFDLTSDGGFILTGANFLNNKSVITLCKLNAEGILR